jgi:hypothetical protein
MAEKLWGVRRKLTISKRDFLLFDHVAVMGLREQFETADAETQASASYLSDIGRLSGAPSDMQGVVKAVREVGRKLLDDSALAEVVADHPELRAALEKMERFGEDRAVANRHLVAGDERILATLLSISQARVFPLASSFADLRQFTAEQRENVRPWADITRGQVMLQVTLPKIPWPGDDVPLEDVLAFGSDSKTLELRDRLMRTLTKADLEGEQPELVAIRLEDAVSDYSAHMRAAKLGDHGSTMMVILSLTGAVEELIRLRPRRAIESLVSYRKVQADRITTDLSAPGRETAFIYEANQRFSK